MAGMMNIAVLAQGDAIAGKDRYGSFSIWENSGPIVGAAPNSVYHWYDSYSYSGSYRAAYMQYEIAQFAEAVASVTSVNLYLYNIASAIIGTGNLGAVNHASNSATATGQASQLIGGNQLVGYVTDQSPDGWISFDVTDYIMNDLTAGFDWAAFSVNQFGYKSMAFGSAEQELASYLQITYTGGSSPVPTPEPATFVLMFLGLGVLGIMKRKSLLTDHR
ncbi:MAG: PEP-CTERM sorting domain-containing protein [Halodesulfovibrio sp.]